MLSAIAIRDIGDKIEKLGTAIFSNSSSALMRLPTSLIKIADRDESGGIWFSIKRQYEDMGGFDKSFFGQLRFYNRLFNYYIEVEGWASIVRVEEDVLIRFQITEAQCVHFKRSESKRFVLALLGFEV